MPFAVAASDMMGGLRTFAAPANLSGQSYVSGRWGRVLGLFGTLPRRSFRCNPRHRFSEESRLSNFKKLMECPRDFDSRGIHSPVFVTLCEDLVF